jgi:hypothetical protein
MSPTEPVAAAARSSGRQRGLEALALLLACVAVLGGAAWGLVSVMVAVALRPPEPEHLSPVSYVQLPALIALARQQLWIFTIVYFAALVALGWAAILIGRRALRDRASERRLARLGTGAGWCLVAGLALGFVPFLDLVISLFTPPSNLSFLYSLILYFLPISVSFQPLTALGAGVVLVALAGAALLVGRRTLGGRASERLRKQLGIAARWCLVGAVGLGFVPFLNLVSRLVSPLSSFSHGQLTTLGTGVVLAPLILAGALGSVMLAGVALGRAAAAPVSTAPVARGRVWRTTTRLYLGAATISGLAVFALLAYAAQVIVGFYLHFVG